MSIKIDESPVFWGVDKATLLKTHIKNKFRSVDAFIKETKLPRQTVYDLISEPKSGKPKSPRFETIVKICGFLDIEPTPFLALTDSQIPARIENDMVEIAQIDLRFGLGNAIADEEVTENSSEKQLFPRQWLRQITSSPAHHLYWARGQGDSMEPLIHEGDVVLIDRSQITPHYGDLVWAVAYGQTCMVKRLRPMPDGSIKILSANPTSPPEVAYDGELNIFGRVIAVVKSL